MMQRGCKTNGRFIYPGKFPIRGHGDELIAKQVAVPTVA